MYSSGIEPFAWPPRSVAADWSGSTIASKRSASRPARTSRSTSDWYGDPHLLLEHEARPALVHRRHPRAVEPHARRPQARGCAAARARRAPRTRARATSGSSVRRAEPATRSVPAGKRRPAVLEGVERPAHLDALGQQPAERRHLAARVREREAAGRGPRAGPARGAARRPARARPRRAPPRSPPRRPAAAAACARSRRRAASAGRPRTRAGPGSAASRAAPWRSRSPAAASARRASRPGSGARPPRTAPAPDRAPPRPRAARRPGAARPRGRAARPGSRRRRARVARPRGGSTASAVRSQCSRFWAACSSTASDAWSCVSTMSASRQVPPGQGAGKLAEGAARVVLGAAALELLRLHLERASRSAPTRSRRGCARRRGCGGRRGPASRRRRAPRSPPRRRPRS